MDLKLGVKALEKLIGNGVTVWVNEINSVYDIAQDSEDLKDSINELDDQVFIKEINENIDDYMVCICGIDCDTRDYTGIIIVDKNKDVIAYGYTGD